LEDKKHISELECPQKFVISHNLMARFYNISEITVFLGYWMIILSKFTEKPPGFQLSELGDRGCNPYGVRGGCFCNTFNDSNLFF
jgi:hypothetical protein